MRFYSQEFQSRHHDLARIDAGLPGEAQAVHAREHIVEHGIAAQFAMESTCSVHHGFATQADIRSLRAWEYEKLGSVLRSGSDLTCALGKSKFDTVFH